MKLILQSMEISKKSKVRYLFWLVSCITTGARLFLFLLTLALEMFAPVTAQCEESRRLLIPSGGHGHLTCSGASEDSIVHICYALYRASISTDSCEDIDVKSQIHKHCLHTSDCTITLDQILGDPCPGIPKLLVLVYSCRADLIFRPEPQFEGGTVTTVCKGKTLEDLDSFEQALSMEFLLGNKNRPSQFQVLAKHFFATGKTVKLAGTKRDLTINFNNNSGPRTSLMTVKLHDVRCEDGIYPSYCRLTVLQEGTTSITTSISQKGRINVHPIPAKPFLKTTSNETAYIELAEKEFFQFECMSNGSDNLQLRWLKYPYGSSTGTLVLNDIKAKKGTIQVPTSCRDVTLFSFHGVYNASAKREDDFSMFQCVMYFEAEMNVVAKSEKIFLFVTPKPVLSTTVVKLASGIQLKNGSAYRYDADAYEGQTLQISCSPSVAEISSVGVIEILRLRLSVFHHGKDEFEIKTVIPPVPSYNKKSNLSIHSKSEVELLGANVTATGVATLLWTIHKAECSGQDFYKCTVWYLKNDSKGVTRDIEAKATHQRIDFQCGVYPVDIKAYNLNGTVVLPEEAQAEQILIMNCIFWGPRSITWNITGHGYSIYVGNSTLEDTVRGVHHELKGEKCYCFLHDKNFSVDVPIMDSNEIYHVASCRVSIPGVGISQSLSYVINKYNEDKGSFLFFLLKMLGAALLILACVVTLFQATAHLFTDEKEFYGGYGESSGAGDDYYYTASSSFSSSKFSFGSFNRRGSFKSRRSDESPYPVKSHRLMVPSAVDDGTLSYALSIVSSYVTSRRSSRSSDSDRP